MRRATLVVRGGTVVTLDPTRRVITEGAVAIDGIRIVEVGKDADIASRYEAQDTIDAGGGLILPGLVDVHLHHTQQLSRGLGDDVDARTWVYDRILPYEAALTPEDVAASTRLTVLEKIRTGTTCVCDPGGYHMDAVGQTLLETGLRGVLSWAAMDDFSASGPVPEDLPVTSDTPATLAEMERHVARWDGAGNGRIRASYSLRTELTTSPDLFRATRDLADRDGTFIQMHAATSPGQVEAMRRKTGTTSVAFLEQLGVLDEGWLLAHVTAITDEEVGLIASRDARIAHQPGASTHGAYGAVSAGRIPELLSAGVTVGLGADANSANNSLDLFRAMNLAATLHKEARVDPSLVSPEEALEMATLRGARALHRETEIGSLEAGKCADVIVVDTHRGNWVPLHPFSLVPTLVYSGQGTDVTTTIVDGRVLMRDGRVTVLDPEAVIGEAQERADRILRRLPYTLSSRWPIR